MWLLSQDILPSTMKWVNLVLTLALMASATTWTGLWLTYGIATYAPTSMSKTSGVKRLPQAPWIGIRWSLSLNNRKFLQSSCHILHGTILSLHFRWSPVKMIQPAILIHKSMSRALFKVMVRLLTPISISKNQLIVMKQLEIVVKNPTTKKLSSFLILTPRVQ